MNNEYINNQSHWYCGDEKFKKTDSCNCEVGIRKSLVAIFECFKMCSYYETDEISIEITLVNGLKYPITVSMAGLKNVCIRSKVASFGDLVISLCEISKVKVLANEPINQKLMRCINTKLCSIANNSRGGCRCNSSYDYLAISYDGPDNFRGNRPPCPPPPPPPPPDPAPPKGEGCCVDEMQRAIFCNREEVNSLGFNGALETMASVASVTSIDYTQVLNSASVTLTSTTVVSNVSIVPSFASVVNTIVRGQSSVVQIVNFRTSTIVADIVPVSTPVLQSIETSPVTVVTDLNFLQPITVVTQVDSTTTPIVSSVNQTSVTVVKSLSLGNEEVVSGRSVTPTTVVSNVTANTVSAVIGLTSVTPLTPIVATIPYILVTGPFPAILTVSINGGTIPVLVNNSPVTIVGITPRKVLPISAETILQIEGNPVVSPVIETVTFDTIVISNISAATLVPVISTVTITPITVLESIKASTIVGIATVTTTTTSITLVDSLNHVVTTVVNNITGETVVAALSEVNPVYEDFNEITQVINVTITQIDTIGLTTVINGVELILQTVEVVNDVSLSTTTISVVENIGLEDVSVITPVTVPINGEILCIGNGILVVQESTGDISIYSTCEINSFSIE